MWTREMKMLRAVRKRHVRVREGSVWGWAMANE